LETKIRGLPNAYKATIKPQSVKDVFVRMLTLKPAMVLLGKYRGWNPMNPEGPCFPVPSVQKMNEYLKEVAVRCRISKRLTTQMARNTFAATVTLTNQIPKEHVREMLGYFSDYMLRHNMQAQRGIPEKA
jgi:hypothetical protein